VKETAGVGQQSGLAIDNSSSLNVDEIVGQNRRQPIHVVHKASSASSPKRAISGFSFFLGSVAGHPPLLDG